VYVKCESIRQKRTESLSSGIWKLTYLIRHESSMLVICDVSSEGDQVKSIHDVHSAIDAIINGSVCHEMSLVRDLYSYIVLCRVNYIATSEDLGTVSLFF
jgi:hypothetical protein